MSEMQFHQSGIFWRAPMRLPHGPSPSPRGRGGNLHGKTPALSLEYQEQSFSFAVTSLFLPSYKNLPLCATPPAFPLLVRWNAAQFVTYLIKPIKYLKFTWLNFCHLTHLVAATGSKWISGSVWRPWETGVVPVTLCFHCLSHHFQGRG